MYKEQIDTYLQSKKEEMLEDLMQLVRTDSQKSPAKPGMPFGEGPAKVLAQAEELMKKCGLKTRNYENYVITGDLGDGEKELDILAHLDVVPVTEDWTVTDPFEPLIKDGRIYGRGTCDDKGPAIAALYALRAIHELGLPLKKSVRLILGSDEECGSSDLDYYYSVEEEAPYSFTPDGDFPVINLEKAHLAKYFKAEFPSSQDRPAVISIKAGSKPNVVPGKAEAVFAGLDEEVLERAADQAAEDTDVVFFWEKTAEDELRLTAKGTAAHASTPQEGCNALTALLHLISMLPLADSEGQRKLISLGKMFPHGDTACKALGLDMEDEESGALTMNLAILDYDGSHLEGAFDSRAPLCANDENLTEQLRRTFADAGMEVEAGGMVPAHYVSPTSSFVRTLLESYERYTGIKGKPLAIGGGTYVHRLKRGVAFGCGIEGVDTHMHGDDEFMEIDTILMSAGIFADAILKLCNE